MFCLNLDGPGRPYAVLPHPVNPRHWLQLAAAFAAIAAALLGLAGCDSSTAGSTTETTSLSALAELGEKIFKDGSLSASGQLACSSCHDSQHAFSQPTASGVSFGGAALDQAGVRNAPSLKYLSATPAFFFDDEGTPTGGFDRDGRANTLAEQAIRPFLTSFEMANTSAADVIDKLSRASYAADFRKLFGEQIFTDADQAFLDAREALQAYQLEDTDFAPYTSKYDYFLAGKAQLTDQELRGYALFNNPEKGNCAGCHPSARRENGKAPLFTDFTYDNLGVPRNALIAANQDATYFDLGLCGPERVDLTDRKDLCGAFKVPTLRNIALTAPYFHNGKFQTLQEVVGFYVRRDTNPEEWYPLGANGLPDKFNDLPAEYKANANVTEVPYNRHEGDAAALSASEIDEVVAFLNTLTDGYQP
jgi:cytochrome c peroxidase